MARVCNAAQHRAQYHLTPMEVLKYAFFQVAKPLNSSLHSRPMVLSQAALYRHGIERPLLSKVYLILLCSLHVIFCLLQGA